MSETFNERVVCVNMTDNTSPYHRFFFSENTYKYEKQVFMFQIAMASLFKAALEYLLKPLGFTTALAQMLSGHILGLTGLARIDDVRALIWPPEVSYFFETLGPVGVMIYLFLIGVKMDLSILMRSSRKAWGIGISTFIVPLIFTVPLAFYLKASSFHSSKPLDKINLELQFPIIAVMASSTSFHVINCFLADLKILNTELGRLASSISTISGVCSWITLIISFTMKQYYEKEKKTIGFALSTFGLIIFITMVLRKIVIWIIKQTPDGKNIKDTHLFIIFLMIPAVGYIGEHIGLHYLFAPMVLGLAIPDGPPVGSALTDKLECFISGLFLPMYLQAIGNSTSDKYWESHPGSLEWTTIFLLLGFLGKFVGAIIPCLFYQMPFHDTVMLGIILTTLGLYDVTMYRDATIRQSINPGVFTTMVYNALIVAAATSLLVKWFYKPSKKYFVNKNHTIQSTKHSAEFRLLICVYNENNVPAIVNLIEASNPTKKSPICVHLLHLIELHGRANPLFISHQSHDYKTPDKSSTPSDHIVNCLRNYEKQNQGIVIVHPYTSITPFISAHEDICTMALNKNTSMIIIPFHKQWNVDGGAIDGITESSKCRNVNQKVLNKAPCSVAILINRGSLNNIKSVVSCSLSSYIISVIFLGGPDDREALVYAMRMAEHSNIHLVVHRLMPINIMINDMTEKILDDNLINEYRLENIVNEHNMYKEEVLKDNFEIVRVLRALENSYDLIIVGRQQDNYSVVFSGLTEWNQYPEIGFFGDMFASSDFKGKEPVLVVQRHCCGK